MIFDTHTHYDDDAFEEDRRDILLSLQQNGIEAVVDVGASLASSARALELAEEFDFVYAAVGVHPTETPELTEENFGWIGEQLDNPNVLAVGEIGLDYYWDNAPKDVQKKWFERQLELAIEKDMPVIIHSREAAEDTLVIMKKYWQQAKEQGKRLTGVIHCFSYGVEMAREYVKMGFYLGIGGVVTFSNSKKVKEVVAETSMDDIVLETDCPYLAPVPFRGKRNSSLNLPYVVKTISELKGIDEDEVVRITNENAKKLYRMVTE